MYNNIRKKGNKFYTGGKIPKYEEPFGKLFQTTEEDLYKNLGMGYQGGIQYSLNGVTTDIDNQGNAITFGQVDLSGLTNPLDGPIEVAREGIKGIDIAAKVNGIVSTSAVSGTTGGLSLVTINSDKVKQGLKSAPAGKTGNSALGAVSKGWNMLNADTSKGQDFGDFANQATNFAMHGGSPAGMIASGVTASVNYADQALMGDKNFDAQSQAIDQAVHGASNALMLSGNPIAMGVGAALEGLNFIDKAAGQTVQGYDVNIASSGFSGVQSEQGSSSYRGSQFKKMENALGRRNEQLRMAMNAADIADEENFAQEARMNSIENTVMNNQIALAGGLSTSMLGD